ncbi:hypothetical protein GCM10010260_72860 [Streptomyces filipinensis]|uniref:Uncharacterized protein n=1 Tax=Streptomyces filipinensis TaxID=66887 RepID=A0A918MFC5_9ACTN|nr:hypothetical protein GCM10010260_72860 [Streptomyces filipinensis]
MWCGVTALVRVLDPRLLGYPGWSGASADAFGRAGVCLGEGDGSLVADLLGGAELFGYASRLGGRTQAGARSRPGPPGTRPNRRA